MADSLGMEGPCPHHERERAGSRPVIGIDEVGRGPLAGPVVAAAVFLPASHGIDGLADSKALTPRKRAALFAEIVARARIGVGAVSALQIDRIGIEPATKLAMVRASRAVRWPEGAVALVDGNRPPDLGPRVVIAEVKADASCPSVAAASIVAKVIRDAAMTRLARRYPDYGWCSNKGYGSKAHREAISEIGVTRHHRLSFLRTILATASA